MRLSTRVLIGIIFLVLITGVGFAYLIRSSGQIESQIRLTNSVYVPAMRALNQIENTFFLLEADIDSSLQEGILRPKDSLEGVIIVRAQLISDLLKVVNLDKGDLRNALTSFLEARESFSVGLEKSYANWNDRSEYLKQLSDARSEFRARMKSLSRLLDLELSQNAKLMETKAKKMEANLLMLSIIGALLSFGFLVYLRRSFQPLEELTHLMRGVSEKGLSEAMILGLSKNKRAVGEIALLWQSFQNMASSLFEQSSTLHSQKVNLERANQEAAAQNEELTKARAKLLQSEKLSLVGQMSAQMAHEIRNPLNAISLHTEILELGSGDRKIEKEFILPIKREIQRLIELTESYLNISKDPKLDMGRFQINDILEDIHQLYQPLFKERGVFFTCDLADIPECTGDKSKLLQALTNLIKNSFEAFDNMTDQKNKFVRLISQRNAEGELEISVLDNGQGISKEQQNDLFTAFNTTKAQGSGLGLITVKQVVEAHRGTVSCESSPGKGTKFTIRLPLLTDINQGVRRDGWVQSKDTHS